MYEFELQKKKKSSFGGLNGACRIVCVFVCCFFFCLYYVTIGICSFQFHKCEAERQ